MYSNARRRLLVGLLIVSKCIIWYDEFRIPRYPTILYRRFAVLIFGYSYHYNNILTAVCFCWWWLDPVLVNLPCSHQSPIDLYVVYFEQIFYLYRTIKVLVLNIAIYLVQFFFYNKVKVLNIKCVRICKICNCAFEQLDLLSCIK